MRLHILPLCIFTVQCSPFATCVRVNARVHNGSIENVAEVAIRKRLPKFHPQVIGADIRIPEMQGAVAEGGPAP